MSENDVASHLEYFGYRKTDREVKRFDVTIHIEIKGFTWEEVKGDIDKALKKLAKKYVYQIEKVSHVHAQVRYHAKISMKSSTAARMWRDQCPNLDGFVTATSMKTGDKFSYCMKDDSRIAGPWRDKKEVLSKDLEKELQLIENNPRPWQGDIFDDVKVWEKTDTFGVIIDVFGLGGKSAVAKLIQARGWGIAVPSSLEPKEMIEYVSSLMNQQDGWEPNCVWLDIPRATDKRSYKKLAAGIEQIKTGLVMDHRYAAAPTLTRGPKVWVTCNDNGILPFWSAKRVVPFLVNSDYELIPYEESEYFKQKETYAEMQEHEKQVSHIIVRGLLKKVMTEKFYNIVLEYYK